MPFKSGNWFCRTIRDSAAIFFLFFTPLYLYPAQATVTVETVSPYVFDSDSTTFFATTAVTTFVDSAEGFKEFDTSIGISASNADTAQLVLFDVTSNSDFDDPDSGEQLVITVFGEETDGDFVAVPIAAAENKNFLTSQDINGIPDGCTDQSNCQSTSGNLMFAARYEEGSTYRLGFYLKDICSISSSLKGCNSGSPDTSSDEIELTFAFGIVGSTAHISNVSDSSETEEIKIGVQTSEPTLNSCTPSSDLANFYFPGDAKILIDSTSGFSFSNATAGSGVNRLIVVGKDFNQTPVTNSNFSISNDIVARLIISVGGQEVNGFINSTESVSHPYKLQFMVRDAAGVVSTSPGDNCSLTGVMTSQIQGFLNNNQCFIATAAYQVRDNASLRLLRRFRDEFLAKSTLGRKGIELYYRWSPPVAEFILEHPGLRYPVLLLLIPIQGMAWVLLNPLFGSVILLCGFFGLLLFLRRKRATGIEIE